MLDDGIGDCSFEFLLLFSYRVKNLIMQILNYKNGKFVKNRSKNGHVLSLLTHLSLLSVDLPSQLLRCQLIMRSVKKLLQIWHLAITFLIVSFDIYLALV